MIVDKLINSIFQSAISGEILNDFKSEPTNDPQRPFTIPDTWEWIQLKDLGEFVRGSGIKRNDTSSSGTQCIRYGEIYTTYNYSFTKAVSFVPDNIAKNCKEAHKNDLLFTLTGESEYEIAKTITYLGEDRLVIGGDMALFTNHNQNPMYLTSFMYSPFAINYKAKNCTGKMIIHTSIVKIQEMYIPLPPLDVQNKIVNKIELILKKLNEVKPLELEIINVKRDFTQRLINSILKSAFEGELVKFNLDDCETNELNKIAEISTGNSISESDKKNKFCNEEYEYDFIATKDLLFDHTFNYDTGVHIPATETKFKKAKCNDILMCIEGGSAGKKIGMLDREVCYGNKLCKFSTDVLYPKFLYYYLQSPQFKSFFNDSLTGLIGGVSINKIKKVEITYPKYDIQVKLVNRIDEILYICNDIENLVKE